MGSTNSINYLATSKANFPRMFGAGVRSCAFSDGFIHKTAAATSHRVARDLRDPPRLIYADSVGRTTFPSSSSRCSFVAQFLRLLPRLPNGPLIRRSPKTHSVERAREGLNGHEASERSNGDQKDRSVAAAADFERERKQTFVVGGDGYLSPRPVSQILPL